MRIYVKGLLLVVGLLSILLLLHVHFRSRSTSDVSNSGRGASKRGRGSSKQNPLLSIERMSDLSTDDDDEMAKRKSERGGRRIDDSAETYIDSPTTKVKKKPTGESGKAVDIRTVDPVAATEPQVIKQQEYLEKQYTRPKTALKINSPAADIVDSYQYPEWYSSSVMRSPTYGHEKDFVGSQPLFPECPNAERIKSQSETEKFGYVIPKPFVLDCKNPCWREKGEIICVPYFYVAGVAKCGTTDLYRRIRYHPDVTWGTLKEYHWWDRLRYGAAMELKFTKDSKKNTSPVPLAEYSRIILGKDKNRLQKELATTGRSELICGDGSPSYLWDISQWDTFEGNEGCNEPRIVPGSFIKRAYEDARIFLIFRHPTTRLYSRFLSRIPRVAAFKNASPRMFHDYAVNAVRLYKECFKRWSVRACSYNVTLYDDAVVRLLEGLYPVYLEDWLRIFRRDQILVFRNEDYAEDIRGHIEAAFEFLGLAALNDSMLTPIVERDSSNVGVNYGTVGPMLPETIAVLNEFYDPFIHRLAELLQDRRFLWKDIVVA